MKVEFHIHTPASHDYRLLPGKLFKDMELDEVFDVGVNEGLYTKEFQEKYKKRAFLNLKNKLLPI